MCVIAICNESRVKEEHFREGFRCNDDGAGFAWMTEDGVSHYRKGFMKGEEAWKAYNKEVPRNAFPHIVHFRAGKPQVPELTHPFIINRKSPNPLIYDGTLPLLFHNGVVTDWRSMVIPAFLAAGEIPKEGDFNDTRIIAMILDILGTELFKFLTGRWAIIQNKEIEYYGDWEKEEDGIVWSNKTYQVSQFRGHNKTYWNNRGNGYMYGYGYEGGWEREWEKETETKSKKKTEKVIDLIDFSSVGIIQKIDKAMEFWI